MAEKILTTTEGTNRNTFSAIDWALFTAISLIWGSSFLLMDIGLDNFAPGLVTWVRVGTGAAALWLFPASRTPIDRADRSRVIVLSFIWVAIPFTLFPVAQQWVNSAVAGMLNGATPTITALVAMILLGRRARGTLLAGLVVGFVGIVLIGIPSIGEGETQALGVVLILTAASLYGVAINIAAPIQQKYGSLPVMARMLAWATLWNTPYGVVALTGSTFAWDSALAVLTTGIVGTGLAFIIFGSLVGRVGGTRSSFITYVIPVIALILGVSFRGDEVTIVAVVGVLAVITGALLASRRD